MFATCEYELLDFGNGRKLERFGPLLVERPCPAAMVPPRNGQAWGRADILFTGTAGEKKSGGNPERGHWQVRTATGRHFFPDRSSAGESDSALPPEWLVRHGHSEFVLRLQGSPFGHLGIFPEQSENWDTVYDWCQRFAKVQNRPARVLNLFAYTGGTTLAAMAGGAEVTHVDAAKNIVSRAKANAVLSFPERSARWIAEDAVRFAAREVKRESFYDAIVLDPPTYGHGARGEVWRFQRDLPKLLALCQDLLRGPDPFLLLTCHVTDLTPIRLAYLLNESLAALRLRLGLKSIVATEMSIRSACGEKLPAGLRVLLTHPNKPA
ncbi:MAG: class I SAM-dependent methyltransferase [Planctomycetia bacterium]|nr:class I SAM-dependent methyltransferase [Planctomycetia bacterium]